MNVLKLVALALAASLMMVGCESKTEAPSTETNTTISVVEDAEVNTTVETETEVVVDENKTIH